MSVFGLLIISVTVTETFKTMQPRFPTTPYTGILNIPDNHTGGDCKLKSRVIYESHGENITDRRRNLQLSNRCTDTDMEY